MASRESSVGMKMDSCLLIASRRLSGFRLIVVPVKCIGEQGKMFGFENVLT